MPISLVLQLIHVQGTAQLWCHVLVYQMKILNLYSSTQQVTICLNNAHLTRGLIIVTFMVKKMQSFFPSIRHAPSLNGPTDSDSYTATKFTYKVSMEPGV